MNITRVTGAISRSTRRGLVVASLLGLVLAVFACSSERDGPSGEEQPQSLQASALPLAAADSKQQGLQCTEAADCPYGASCINGECRCWETDSEPCVDPEQSAEPFCPSLWDSQNCGRCGKSCGKNHPVCSEGECRRCEDAYSYYSDWGYDVRTCDGQCIFSWGGYGENKCTKCEKGCPTSRPACVDGECRRCEELGLLTCKGQCVQSEWDSNNCGGCGMVCSAETPVCSEAQCRSCEDVYWGTQTCDGQCVDVYWDPNNCGGCGIVCPSGAYCDYGSCQCPWDRPDVCDGSCVDLQSDYDNCGSCGAQCSGDEQCRETSDGASCVCTFDTCDGVCTDLDTSEAHCGSCGNACAAGQKCFLGQCRDEDPVCGASCGNTALCCGASGQTPPGFGWVYCSAEDEYCAFTGTREVAYGAQGMFVYQTHTDGVGCNNDTFGDPLFGAVKHCWYRDSSETGEGGAGGAGAEDGSEGAAGAGSPGPAPGDWWCLDIQRAAQDVSNCGGCGIVCNAARNESCLNGVCACAGVNPAECAGRCADLAYDPANCGGCGIVCNDPQRPYCVAGDCAAAPAGLVDDLEGEIDIVPARDGRTGYWVAFDDGTREPALREYVPGGGYGETTGIRLLGQVGDQWGPSLMATLASGGFYDARSRGYTGIQFWARSDNPGYYWALLEDTWSHPEGGWCSEDASPPCWDDAIAEYWLDSSWTLVRLPWESFSRMGWGGYPDHRADATALRSIQFRTSQWWFGPGEPVDLVVDDVELLRPCASPCDASRRQSCVHGMCTCAGENPTECDGVCVNLDYDPAHCGDCSSPCEDPELPYCVQGLCAAEPGMPSTCSYHTFNGHTYAKCTEAKAWRDARLFCLTYGAHLVSVGSAEENAFLYSIGRGMDDMDYWSGMNDSAHEGEWVWESGEPASYFSWAAGEPDNCGGEYGAEGEDCCELGGFAPGQWNDLTCDNPLGFICEWDFAF
jgi:hypothetical protein